MFVGFLDQAYQSSQNLRKKASLPKTIGFKSNCLHSDVFQKTSGVAFSGNKTNSIVLEIEKMLKNIEVNNKFMFDEAKNLENLVSYLVAYDKLPNIGEGAYKTVFKMEGAENNYAVKVLKRDIKSKPSFNVQYIQGKDVKKANRQINQRIIRVGPYSIDYFVAGSEVGLKNLNIKNSLPNEVLQNYFSEAVLNVPQEKMDEFAMITKKLHKQKKNYDFENPNNFRINDDINYIDDVESNPIGNIDSLLNPLLVTVATNNKAVYNADEKVLNARNNIFKKIVKASIKADIDFMDFSNPCKSIYGALEITGRNKIKSQAFVAKINEIKVIYKCNPDTNISQHVDNLFDLY